MIVKFYSICKLLLLLISKADFVFPGFWQSLHLKGIKRWEMYFALGSILVEKMHQSFVGFLKHLQNQKTNNKYIAFLLSTIFLKHKIKHNNVHYINNILHYIYIDIVLLVEFCSTWAYRRKYCRNQ